MTGFVGVAVDAFWLIAASQSAGAHDSLSVIDNSGGVQVVYGPSDQDTPQAASLPATAQPAPVIDNELVIVWDIILERGATGLVTPHDLDTVVMFLEGGRIRTVVADGNASTAAHKFGDAVFVPKGTDARQTLNEGVTGFLRHRVKSTALETIRAVRKNQSH